MHINIYAMLCKRSFHAFVTIFGFSNSRSFGAALLGIFFQLGGNFYFFDPCYGRYFVICKIDSSIISCVISNECFMDNYILFNIRIFVRQNTLLKYRPYKTIHIFHVCFFPIVHLQQVVRQPPASKPRPQCRTGQ